MNFRKRFKIGQLVRIGAQRKKGQVVDLTNFLVVVDFGDYRESFNYGQLLKKQSR